MEFENVLSILAAFEAESVEYVLVGSMAMAAQGIVRATRDMDVFVSPESENVERLRRALKTVFEDDPNVDEIRAEDLAGDYPAIEYIPPHGLFSLDILARLGEAYGYENLQSEELEVEGIRIRVATPRTLYEMKKGTVRPQDKLDAEVLRRRFDLEIED